MRAFRHEERDPLFRRLLRGAVVAAAAAAADATGRCQGSDHEQRTGQQAAEGMVTLFMPKRSHVHLSPVGGDKPSTQSLASVEQPIRRFGAHPSLRNRCPRRPSRRAACISLRRLAYLTTAVQSPTFSRAKSLQLRRNTKYRRREPRRS